jgi:hypothetical protein
LRLFAANLLFALILPELRLYSAKLYNHYITFRRGRLMKNRNTILRPAAALLLISMAATIVSCGKAPDQPSIPAVTAASTTAPTPIPDPPQILSVAAIANPSVSGSDMPDPSTEINPSLIDIYHPDSEELQLYNDAFRAVEQQLPDFDLSGYDMPFSNKAQACNLLYGESAYHLANLKYMSFSEEEQRVNFTYYTDNKAEANHKQETLNARLSQLLYNVAPVDGTELQKLLSVYQYLCETSDYSSDTTDGSKIGPDSILVNHMGICSGYAMLVSYVLQRIGVQTEYICNEAHAWNIVTIDGAAYHMDVTFGAGLTPDSSNTLDTVLMDDEERLATLENAGVDPAGIIIGFPGGSAVAPPACTDTRYETYTRIHDNYALDIAGNRIFINDAGGIKSMDLDCSHLITQTKMTAIHIVYFDGAVYFLSLENGHLYKMIPGSDPELLYDSGNFCYLTLDETNLSYSQDYEGTNAKTINLALPDANVLSASGIREIPSVTMPRSTSFYFEVKFSKPMSAETDWAKQILVCDDTGRPLKVNFAWNSDRTILTIRPYNSVDTYSFVTLCALADAAAEDSGLLSDACSMRVNIESCAGVPA